MNASHAATMPSPATASADPGGSTMSRVYIAADRMLLAVLATCVAAAVGLSLHFGGTPTALAVGLPILAVAAALVWLSPGSLLTRLYM
ncbi:MAG: hypothetical protein EHM87_22565, partial [Burkholderiales bacterium]